MRTCEAHLAAQHHAAETVIMEWTPAAEVTLTRVPGAEVTIPTPLMEVPTPMQLRETKVTLQAGLSPLQGSPSSAERRVSSWEHVTALSQALLVQQEPPLPVFSGDGDGVEGIFADWHEQLELIANMCQWGDQRKLIKRRDSVSFLPAPVPPMYKPATISWCNSCQRFTLVQIQSVQSSLVG